MADTEGGRIARLQAAAQRCAAEQALARAGAGPRGKPCGSACDLSGGTTAQRIERIPVPPESTYLETRACPVVYSTDALGTRYGVPTTQGNRIAALQQVTVDTYFKDRLAAFRRPYFPPVCPPIPQEALNANVPKIPGDLCQATARALGIYKSATA